MAKKKWQGDVRESAHKIWLAGLGALAVAEEEGSKLFKTLVEQGQKYEAVGKDKVKDAGRDLDEAAKKARKSAEDVWGKLEEGFESRVNSVIHRVGVPSREEIAALSRRVEELTRAVDRLHQEQTGGAKTAAKPATTKPAAPKAAAAAPKAAKPASKASAGKPAPPKAAAGPRPAATRASAKPAPATMPKKITTAEDVTTTADVTTAPR